MEDYKKLNHTKWQCKYHGRDTETIKRYIADQEKEDQRFDQLEIPWIESQTSANKKN